jgi:hypothetical protein
MSEPGPCDEAHARRAGESIHMPPGLSHTKVYQRRSLVSLEPVTVNSFQIKRYELHYAGPAEQILALEQWLELLGRTLPSRVDGVDDGVGFAVFHVGCEGTYFQVGTWCHGHVLRHQLFEQRSTIHGRSEFLSMASTGIIGCIWELKLLCFERDTWERCAMDHGERAGSLERYLAERPAESFV